MTVRVILNDAVLAESENPIVLEGNYYFPPEAIRKANFLDSNTSTVCPWKGTASYYDAAIGGKTIVKDVAWYYPNPKAKAAHIKNHVAFYKNKVIIED